MHRLTTLAGPSSSPSISKLPTNKINSFFISPVSNIVSAFQLPAKNKTVNNINAQPAENQLNTTAAFSFQYISEHDVKTAISFLESPATSSQDKMS